MIGLLEKILKPEEKIDEITENTLDSMQNVDKVRYYHRTSMQNRLEKTVQGMFKEGRYYPNAQELEELAKMYDFKKIPVKLRIKAATNIAEREETDRKTFYTACHELKLDEEQMLTAVDSALLYLMEFPDTTRVKKASETFRKSPEHIKAMGIKAIKRKNSISLNFLKEFEIVPQEEINARYIKNLESAINGKYLHMGSQIEIMKDLGIPREKVLEIIFNNKEKLRQEKQNELLYVEFPEYKRTELIRDIHSFSDLEKIATEIQLTPDEQNAAAEMILHETVTSNWGDDYLSRISELQKKYLSPTKTQAIIEEEAHNLADSDEESRIKISKIERVKKILNEFMPEQKKDYLEEMLNEEERMCVFQEIRRTLSKADYENMRYSHGRDDIYATLHYYESLKAVTHEEIRYEILKSGMIPALEKVMIERVYEREDCLKLMKRYQIESKVMKKVAEIKELAKA